MLSNLSHGDDRIRSKKGRMGGWGIGGSRITDSPIIYYIFIFKLYREMNDGRIALAGGNIAPSRVVHASTVNIKLVSGVHWLKSEKIDLRNLKPAVLIGETLIIGQEMPQGQTRQPIS